MNYKSIFSIWEEQKQSWGVPNEPQGLSLLLIVIFIAEISNRLYSIYYALSICCLYMFLYRLKWTIYQFN